jgi:putative phosphoesterase
MKIGLIADTHIPEAGKSLPERIIEIFKDVEFIFHAGDLHILDVLDWLESIAPVKAARGNGDDGTSGRPPIPEDPRLSRAHVMTIEGLRIGLVHALPLPDEGPWVPLEKTMDRLFGGPVGVIVFGDTHVEYIKQHAGVLLVNPGSPTLPNNQVGQAGTVGILEIDKRNVVAKIVPIEKGHNQRKRVLYRN